MRRGLGLKRPFAAGVLAAALGASAAAAPDAAAVSASSQPQLVPIAFRGVSPAVSSLSRSAAKDGSAMSHREPGGDDQHSQIAFDEHGRRYGTGTPKVSDPLASIPPTAGEHAAPELVLEIDGIPSSIFGPPDSEGAVGPRHYVQAVNMAFEVFDKQGRPITDPIPLGELWSGLAGGCANDLFVADPTVVYDELADRWLLSYLGFESGAGPVPCIAVSTSGSPTGEYFLYELETVEVADYFKLGVWPDETYDAYLMGTNSGPPGVFDVYALDRQSLLAGVEPRPAQRFSGNPSFLMPADLDGSRLAPAGSPGLFYTFRDGGESYFIPPTAVDTLDLYELAVRWDDPTASTFTHATSFASPVLADFNWTLCGIWNGDCLDQPGTDQQLDTISWWPLPRLQYRNLGDYETLAGVWTVNTEADGLHAAPRWFELRRAPGEGWQLAHQGTFAPDSAHRWMASVALDGSGNMALGYNVVEADAGVYPSLRSAVRPLDSPQFEPEITLVEGSGFQTGTNRWGDYASLEVDPVDDCTFWFTGEYIETSGDANWRTRIVAFKLPGCTGSLHPPQREELPREVE